MLLSLPGVIDRSRFQWNGARGTDCLPQGNRESCIGWGEIRQQDGTKKKPTGYLDQMILCSIKIEL